MDLIKNGTNDPDLNGVDRITLDKNLNVCVQPEKKPGATIRYKLVRGESPGDYKYDTDHKEIITESIPVGLKGSRDNSQSSDKPHKSEHTPKGEAQP